MASIPESERANVLYCVGDSGLNIIAKGAYQGGVVDMCANNIGVVVEKATGSGTGNEVSFEQIANWNPGVILFATNGKDAGDFYEAAGTDPTWASSRLFRAVRTIRCRRRPITGFRVRRRTRCSACNGCLACFTGQVLHERDRRGEGLLQDVLRLRPYRCGHFRADGSRSSDEVGCELLPCER